MGDSWRELVIVLGVASHETARFPPGDEADRILKWLEERCRLGELPDALRRIDRPDLAAVFDGVDFLGERSDGYTDGHARLLTATLEPIRPGPDLFFRSATLNGTHYGDSVVHKCAYFCRDIRSSVSYDLGGRYRSFESVVGVLDEAEEDDQTGYFQVFLGKSAAPTVAAKHGAPERIRLDVTGVLRLRLVAYRSDAIGNPILVGAGQVVGKSARLAALAWGDPTLFE
ncbi:NPCBM/NEW2 domain-containing protein [Nocardia seriolae]|nr:NPCBM/NEW2 domain-containing protein [Nocardia seriolae]QOW36196.1 NPCBM/NEW2 domain-containing protein [Nocardia seriolae]